MQRIEDKLGGTVKLAEVTDESSSDLPPVLLGHIGEDWDTKKTVRAIIAIVTTFSTFTFSIDSYLSFQYALIRSFVGWRDL